MMLIETDILLALVSVEDKHHMEALKLVGKLEKELVLSSYSFIELDSIIRSGKVLISDIPAFYQAIRMKFKALQEMNDLKRRRGN